jgi:hypothetical protein
MKVQKVGRKAFCQQGINLKNQPNAKDSAFNLSRKKVKANRKQKLKLCRLKKV